MKMRNLRPSPGAVIGVVALVFALTGAAYAATKIQTNDIAKRAVTGGKIARDAVKSGKIRDGKIKARDLADGVIPSVPNQAYGRVNKNGTTVAPVNGSSGITGVSSGGAGVICYDLAFEPVSGTANAVTDSGNLPGSTVEVRVGAAPGCAAPYTDAQTLTTTAAQGEPTYQEGSPADEDVFVDFVR
jgi:hypothetical protein